MKITIVGSGNMGAGFVQQFTRVGHTVRITARDHAKAQALAAANPGAVAVPAAEALGDTDVVVLAVPFADAVVALQSLGDLQDRVVIDITNPLTPDYMGLTIGHSTSAAEEIARAFPGVALVKAFNTVFAQVLAEGPNFANGVTVPVYFAGDTERARQTARVLIESIGFTPVDAGALKNARYLEPLGGLNIYFGYGAGQGTQIAPIWAHRS